MIKILKDAQGPKFYYRYNGFWHKIEKLEKLFLPLWDWENNLLNFRKIELEYGTKSQNYADYDGTEQN